MKKYDLIVIGGGMSGVAASVAAARANLSVLLIEKSGALGGATANAFVFPFMPFWTRNKETKEKIYLVGGILREILDLQKELFNNDHDTYYSPEYLKIVLDKYVLSAGVDILFHGVLYDVVTSYKRVEKVKVIAGSEKLEFDADFFIDTTGDGNLFYMAGCDYELGRREDGLCQPMTTCFRMDKIDTKQFYIDEDSINQTWAERQKRGEIKNPREDILAFDKVADGILNFNTTRIIKRNPCNPFDVSKAEIEAREQIFEVEKFLKEVSPLFKDSSIISIAPTIGVRESRRLVGEHVLTADELKDCTKFDDAIALCNYDIDIHNPSGTGTSHYYFSDEEYYTIPYRSLLPKEFDNLLVAGRCISTTHEAQASVRTMPTCTCMGEAAGTAIGVAKNSNKNTHTLDTDLLRKTLKENGAILEI